MVICAPADKNKLSARITRYFAKCHHFILIDSRDMSWRAVANPYRESSGEASAKAGILVARQGAEVVLSCIIENNACFNLQMLGVQVFTGITGTVEEAVGDYRSGKLRPLPSANPARQLNKGES